MKIAVEGCAHGELETIYDTIACLEEKENVKIDLLICCGDFQCCRNEEDLRCMAVPPVYYHMCSFYKYYSGEKLAPILTIFVGGNHEASNYLQELPYGGWVAPRIYYLGYAGVIDIAGVRIAGISGIYNNKHYWKGHFESAPYNNNAMRSVYHIRRLEVFRLKQLSNPIDIFLSHDWPTGICEYGDKNQLIRFKPHFREDIETGQLGSKPGEELLKQLQPRYWFAAHLHCKFSALVPHDSDKCTKFLALDKCLPKRRFLQILDIPHDPKLDIEIKYDLEWLTILLLTNHLTSCKGTINYMPSSTGYEGRWNFTPEDYEKQLVLEKFDSLTVPNNFEKTAASYIKGSPKKVIDQPQPVANPQTTFFCDVLGIDDPLTLKLNLSQPNLVDESQTPDGSFNDSFQQCTDSDVSGNSTPRKRTSLNMPQPRGTSEFDGSFQNSFDESHCQTANVSVSSVESTSSRRDASFPQNANANYNESYTYENINDNFPWGRSMQNNAAENAAQFSSNAESDQSLTNSPIPKKFKRRNADFYKF